MARKIKITSWNINSVRLRIDQVVEFLKQEKPDVLALQEIKCNNDQFPEKAIHAAGYEHIAVAGQKAYHGVATISRLPLSKVKRTDYCKMGDARHISVMVDDLIEFHNFYVPAGGDEPDIAVNPKFDHKLKFMSEMASWSKNLKQKTTAHRIIVGDFNVAPDEQDVWSHKQLLKVVSHTPIEVNHMAKILNAGQWTDIARELYPSPEKLFSWWSYRSKDWRASNRGRRLDHIWVSPSLKDASTKGGAKNYKIHDDVRGWTKPSDHAPISLTLTL